MPDIVVVALIVPIAAVIGGLIGIAAARQDIPALRAIPFWVLFVSAVLAFLPPPLRRPEALKAAIHRSNGQLAPVREESPETMIRVLDCLTGLEDNWCQYPIIRAGAAVEALNELYGGQKLFWRQGEERPDVRAKRLELETQQRESARYITRPLARKGVPVYRNNTRPAEVIAYAPDRAAALALQEQLMRERGLSTTIPGEGA